MALMACFLPLAFIMACIQADNPAELATSRVWDIFLGLLLAIAIVLLGVGKKSKRTTLGRAAVAWLFVSSSLLFWHEMIARARWTLPRRHVAANLVKATKFGLEDYVRDCGSLPTSEQGLAALMTNPGVAGWAGPYVEKAWLIDPWGNALQFETLENRASVWSKGRDGLSGTDDDIRQEVVEHTSGIDC